jgi:hypothetical protein
MYVQNIYEKIYFTSQQIIKGEGI